MNPPNACANCTRVFKTKSALTNHQNKATSCTKPDSKIDCLACGRVLATPSSLKRHLPKCKGQKTIDDLGQDALRVRKKADAYSARLAAIEHALTRLTAVPIPPMIVMGDVTNNVTINVTINNYYDNDVDVFAAITRPGQLTCSNIMQGVTRAMYFNPDSPQNQSFRLLSIDPYTWECKDVVWRTFTLDKEGQQYMLRLRTILDQKVRANLDAWKARWDDPELRRVAALHLALPGKKGGFDFYWDAIESVAAAAAGLTRPF